MTLLLIRHHPTTELSSRDLRCSSFADPKPGDNVVVECRPERRRIGVVKKLRIEHSGCLIRIANKIVSLELNTTLR